MRVQEGTLGEWLSSFLTVQLGLFLPGTRAGVRVSLSSEPPQAHGPGVSSSPGSQGLQWRMPRGSDTFIPTRSTSGLSNVSSS